MIATKNPWRRIENDLILAQKNTFSLFLLYALFTVIYSKSSASTVMFVLEKYDDKKERKKNLVYLKGVEQHLVMHLDQPRDTRHLCIWHGVKYDVVDTKKWHQHQCGLQ